MINYRIIDDSINFYSGAGFERIESPWTVTSSIADITKPADAKNFSIAEKAKVLVASGEQSFLYLYNKGFLPKGQFQTVTPCFRDEEFTPFHTKYFIKNELIKTDSATKKDLEQLLFMASTFFQKWGIETVIIPTGNFSYDLTYQGIELGSYGIRSCDYLTWVYGTGVAEPRMSKVMEKYGIPL